jgi:HK97 family phage major capsid protein
MPPLPGLGRSGFDTVLVPADLAGQIIDLLVGGAPFASSITRLPTAVGTVAFPVASPSGAAWVAELDTIPQMTLGDDALVIEVAKLAGLLDISNESIDDTQFDLMGQISTILRDTLSRQLDEGLLTGAGAPAPTGLVAGATAATGASAACQNVASRPGSVVSMHRHWMRMSMRRLWNPSPPRVQSFAAGSALPGACQARGHNPVAICD